MSDTYYAIRARERAQAKDAAKAAKPAPKKRGRKPKAQAKPTLEQAVTPKEEEQAVAQADES